MPESANYVPSPDPIRRGTTTAQGAHEDVSLYEYFEQRLHALEATSRGLSLAQHEFFTANMEALDARLAAQMVAQREITQVRFDASQQAITKAELSTSLAINKAGEAAERRFEGINNFRQSLIDANASFCTREALAAGIKEAKTAVDVISADAARNALLAASATSELSNRVSNMEGRSFGYSAAIGIVVTILSALFALIGHIIKS